MVAFTISRIYLMIYLIDITNIDKICDKAGQKFLCLQADWLLRTGRGGVNYKYL